MRPAGQTAKPAVVLRSPHPAAGALRPGKAKITTEGPHPERDRFTTCGPARGLPGSAAVPVRQSSPRAERTTCGPAGEIGSAPPATFPSSVRWGKMRPPDRPPELFLDEPREGKALFTRLRGSGRRVDHFPGNTTPQRLETDPPS